MIRKIFLTLIIPVILTSFFLLKPVHAQSSCDLCGYCEGGATPGNWASCVKCLYPTEIQQSLISNPDSALSLAPITPGDKSYTVFGCVSTTSGGFVEFFVNFLTTITTGVAFLGILYGGAKVMTAKGDPEALAEGKRYVYGSLAGLLVVIFSAFIVRLLGKQILNLPFFK